MKSSALILAIILSISAAADGFEAAIPGGIFAFKLPEGTTKVTYLEKPVFIHQTYALVAVPLSVSPGTQAVTLQSSQGEQTVSFEVVPHSYTEQHITIQNEALVSPPKDVQARITNEAIRQRGLYAAHLPRHSVQDGFEKPLEGITTSLFGHKRFFNGKPRNPHSGLDIAADTGTPIGAAGGGIVTLADDLYFNGNTVFIDHGQGLITMYCHMSELLVAEGDKVQKGQTIGLVGATGRATGPHLHWTVSLNGTRVDPLRFTTALNQVLAVTGPNE